MATDKVTKRGNLVKECERLKTCEFFKVATDQDSEEVLNEYVKVFCRGPLQEKCYRLDYLKKTGVLPKSTISPSGLDFLEYI